jgi:hypothetical protein
MDIGPRLGENEGVLRHLLVLTSLVLACGPDAAATEAATTVAEGGTATSDTSTSDTATSDTATSDTPTSTAEATQAATTGTVSTDPVTTDPVTTEPAATSTGDGSTSTTGDGTTGDGTTGDGTTGEDSVEYAAYFWAGGLDHIMVHRADLLNDRCTTLHFAWPGGMDPAFKISAPNEWAVANAQVSMGTADCLAGMPMGASESAIGGQGAATWRQDPNLYCPLQIDLDLVLDFPQMLPWVPAQEHMLVTALPVQNCP